MVAASGSQCIPATTEELHAAFLRIMPSVETHARVRSHHISCPGKRDDFVAEAVSLAYQWFTRARQQGKDLSACPAALATLAVRAVRSGRRLAGQERARDVMSPVAQARYGFKVEGLSSATAAPHQLLYGNPHGQEAVDVYEERLHSNTQTPVIDQAIFRCDFKDWMDTLPARNRQVANELMAGERTQDVARKVHLSQGRISQMRRELHESWLMHLGEWDGQG